MSLLQKLHFTTQDLRRFMKTRFRRWRDGISIIRSKVFSFYIAISKTVVHNHLRMLNNGIFAIIGNLNKDVFAEGPSLFEKP